MTKQKPRDLSSPELEDDVEEDQEVEQLPVINKRVLSRDEILGADDLIRESVDVPEWGVGAVVYVGTMSSFERDKFEDAISGKGGGVNVTNIRARVASLTIMDEDGNRLFTDDDITKLGKKSSKALDRVLSVAQRLNGLSEKDVEDLAKNS